MIRDFVHLIQNKLRHYAVFPSLHSLSRSSAFQTALFLLGVLAFARACISAVSYTHLRAHETRHDLVCRLLLEKKKTATSASLVQPILTPQPPE